MLPFGVTILATVPQRSEIPEGLMNYPVFKLLNNSTPSTVWGPEILRAYPLIKFRVIRIDVI